MIKAGKMVWSKLLMSNACQPPSLSHSISFWYFLAVLLPAPYTVSQSLFPKFACGWKIGHLHQNINLITFLKKVSKLWNLIAFSHT